LYDYYEFSVFFCYDLFVMFFGDNLFV